MKKLLVLISSILLLTACSGEDSEKQVTYTYPGYGDEITYTVSGDYISKISLTTDYTDSAVDDELTQEEFEQLVQADEDADGKDYYSFKHEGNFKIVESFDFKKISQEDFDIMFGSAFGELTDKGIKEEVFVQYLKDSGFTQE